MESTKHSYLLTIILRVLLIPSTSTTDHLAAPQGTTHAEHREGRAVPSRVRVGVRVRVSSTVRGVRYLVGRWGHGKWGHGKWSHGKWGHGKWSDGKWGHGKWSHGKWSDGV